MEEEDDIDMSDEDVKTLSQEEDPAPPPVQSEVNKELNVYENDLRLALQAKFGV